MKTHLKAAISLATLAVALAGAPAFAQSPTQESEQDPQQPTSVDEIIVTAQKREQSLQDVPIVVTAIGADQLQDAGVRDIKDLTVVTPGLNVTSSTSNATTVARIRGVGTIGDNPGLESSVGVVIDGVYRPRTGVAFGDLGELERIEVLKGPQGTLFGRNTSAGVINVITRRPDFSFGADAEATFGNYDARGGSVSVTGPLLDDQLAGRLFFAAREREGFYDVRLGEGPRARTDDQDEDYMTTRGQLLWVPNERLDALLIADYSHRYESCCVAVTTLTGPTTAFIDALATDEGIQRPADPFERLANANRSTDQKITDAGVSLQVDFDFTEDLTLTSITAARDYESENGQESDFTSADIWYRTPEIFGNEFRQFSQELRLAGATETLDYLFGVFYAKEELDTRQGITFGVDYEPYFGLLLSAAAPTGPNPLTVSAITGLPFGTNFPVGGGGRDVHAQETESFALFTNNSFRPMEDLEVTLGLRYTVDDKQVDSQYRNASPGNACRAAVARAAFLPPAAVAAICAPTADFAFDSVNNRQERREDEMTGTLKLAYRFSPEVLTYASYARGYKSGGFNLDRARFGPGQFNGDTSFPAETVDSYEIGAKNTLLDDTLLLNGTIFHQTFENFQLNTYTGISFLVASIPEVVSRGLDLDFVYFTPIEGLNASGGVTYAETQYTDFTPPAGISARLPGSRLSYAPLYSASASVSYERDIAALRFKSSLSAKYTSEYSTGSDLNPVKSQEPLTLVNARVGLSDADERYTVELWAQNLTDEDYFQVITDQPLQTGNFIGFLGAPRTYGVTLRASF